MIVSRAMAYACLTFLAWALALVAVLLLILVVVQHLRGDGAGMPAEHLIAAAVSAGLGWACHLLARRFV
jgi:preprotein translocase subunit SecG